jgi:hypothetical protein
MSTYTTVFNTTSYAACPSSQRKENKHATTHIVKVDTILSPKLGVTQEGHCQPGMDPTPRTSQTEQKLAMQGYPWGSWWYTNTQQDLPASWYT